MGNTHGIADMAYELQATCEDLLPACIVSNTFPTVPVSSMTLAAFGTIGYVRDGQALIYVEQPALTLPLSGSDGTYWISLARDISTAYASWTRRAGSHYLWRLSGTRPPDADGYLVFASCTVAGGIITAVTPAPGVTRAEAWRTLGGLGTMATQNANAVAITGGSATLDTCYAGQLTSYGSLGVGGGSPGGTGNVQAAGVLGLAGKPVDPAITLGILHHKPGRFGILLQASVSDVGNQGVVFQNMAGTFVGTIDYSATATSYNTTSDARLKHSIEPLTDSLDVIAALHPVRFRWNSTDERDEGFLAHELQQHIPHAVTGQPDALNPDGTIRPQQVDNSKLVVWLVRACQELAARVEALETALGV